MIELTDENTLYGENGVQDENILCNHAARTCRLAFTNMNLLYLYSQTTDGAGLLAVGVVIFAW